MSELEFERGNVSFVADGQMTIEQVAKLAESAQLVGIPAMATVTDIRFRWNYQNHAEIDVSWQMPRE